MSDSDSPLSDPPASDEEVKPSWGMKGGKIVLPKLKKKQKKPAAMSGPAPAEESDVIEGEETEAPHEYVLADNSDVAVITMFRNRFAEIFPKTVTNLGPQDIERGVVESRPGEQIENLLCALLGFVLNRQKPPERGHHTRALEEALSSQRSQWPKSWNGVNILSGGKSFADLDPSQRLTLLRSLVHWCLASSNVVKETINAAYKQQRKSDDLNQPMAVVPWGNDSKKRRFWLVEGHNDTPFRIYRESEKKRVRNTWWSVAGSIDEARELARMLEEDDRSQSARRLASGILTAIPRLEDQERKRQRKQYRYDRRAQFQRPEPGVSMYEGRTRGNRVRYNYDDDEMYGSDASNRRSGRQSGTATPAADGPTYTASGRAVRSRFGRSYGDANNSSSKNTTPVRDFDSDDDGLSGGASRPTRSGRAGAAPATNGRASRRTVVDDSDEDMEDPAPSGDEWEGDDQDVTGAQDDADDESELSDAVMRDEQAEDKSLVIKLRVSSSDPIEPKDDAPSRPMDKSDLMDVDELGSSPPGLKRSPSGAVSNGLSASNGIKVATTNGRSYTPPAAKPEDGTKAFVATPATGLSTH